jgi:branched-chain amino acid transport system substrate-binding protein
MMTPRHMIKAAVVGILGMLTLTAEAQSPVRIGFVTTLSGPAAYIGQDIRDGFQLAIEVEGGKLGGFPVEVSVNDDLLKPGQAKQIMDRLLKNEGVKLFTGIVFSNVAAAVVPDVLDAGGLYVSANAAPSVFAGKNCHANYFVVPWQNDSLHESAGQAATEIGYKKAFVLAPNYQGGKDAIDGFKRYFKGEVVGELYTRLDQTDYAAEMAQVRAAKPDVVFQFHPGGNGIAFLRQYQQAGLLGSIPMVLSVAMDQVVLKAVGDAALGVYVTAHWNADLENEANKTFMNVWSKKYGRTPTWYASQGYDTALAIAATLKTTGGRIDDAGAFRKAMLKADFQSTRGKFKFNNNQHPVQDWYLIKIEKDDRGQPFMKTQRKVFTDHADAYAGQCNL